MAKSSPMSSRVRLIPTMVVTAVVMCAPEGFLDEEGMGVRRVQRCTESSKGLQRIVIRCSRRSVRSLERF